MDKETILPAETGMRTERRILLAEDDEALAHFLVELFESEGYEVNGVRDGSAILTMDLGRFDLLVLDLNLPNVDGMEVLRQIRLNSCSLPVLVVTARSRGEGLLPALDCGADDGLLKPFSYLELLARIRVLLRRRTPAIDKTSSCADLVLQREHTLVKRGDRRIELTQREYALLEFLMRTPGIPVPRTTLLRAIWGEQCEPSTNVVDVYMKYVRDKVDLPGLPRLVHTVRGTGYMLSAA